MHQSITFQRDCTVDPVPHHGRHRASCAVANSSSSSSSSSTSSSSSSSSSCERAWQIGKYYTKKLSRKMDDLGNMQDNETVDMVTSQRKLHLAVQVTSRETGMPQAELLQRVELLLRVLPDMDAKLQSMKQADVVKLAHRVDDVTVKLLLLKQTFPEANVSRLCTECTHMLLLDTAAFTAAVQKAESLLCGAGSPSALLNAMPMLLDPDVLQEVLQQVERLFGGSCQPLQLLQHNPSLALSCVSLKGQSRGERDVEYLGGIFAAGGQQEQ